VIIFQSTFKVRQESCYSTSLSKILSIIKKKINIIIEQLFFSQREIGALDIFMSFDTNAILDVKSHTLASQPVGVRPVFTI